MEKLGWNPTTVLEKTVKTKTASKSLVYVYKRVGDLKWGKAEF